MLREDPQPMPPDRRPSHPFFSSGPCAKRPGWSSSVLDQALSGRSHRSRPGKEKLAAVIDKTRAILNIPPEYQIAIVPASDTGAVEMALWSLLGARGVDILAWESFGKTWVADVTSQLKLEDVRVFEAPYGKLPELSQVSADRDIVFTWNGTTSGVRVPDADWISDHRSGLTICDATSAAFAMALPWQKLDVTTWSWQKVLGGEGAHGMIVLSPRAVERLETYTPPWPLPKIFRLTKAGKLNEGIFRGETINTPSMLCVEDVLDALDWADRIGGLTALIARSSSNLQAVSDWVCQHEWVDFLAEDPSSRSSTSICLKLVGPDKDTAPRKIAQLLEAEAIAYDIDGYRDAPPGLRLWGGATIDPQDMQALLPWLDWAYQTVKGD
jgi:phosphoserine aminotransferase